MIISHILSKVIVPLRLNSMWIFKIDITVIINSHKLNFIPLGLISVVEDGEALCHEGLGSFQSEVFSDVSVQDTVTEVIGDTCEEVVAFEIVTVDIDCSEELFSGVGVYSCDDV